MLFIKSNHLLQYIAISSYDNACTIGLIFSLIISFACSAPFAPGCAPFRVNILISFLISVGICCLHRNILFNYLGIIEFLKHVNKLRFCLLSADFQQKKYCVKRLGLRQDIATDLVAFVQAESTYLKHME